MTKFQNNDNNRINLNKKPAIGTDSLESRNDSISSVLASTYIIANQDSLSMVVVVDKILGCGPEGNRTPETLMLKQSSNHSGPTAFSLYQRSKNIHNS